MIRAAEQLVPKVWRGRAGRWVWRVLRCTVRVSHRDGVLAAPAGRRHVRWLRTSALPCWRRGSLLRPGASGSLRRVARGRTVCLLGTSERRDQRRHPRLEPPRLMANAPNQVWTWDITRRTAQVGDLSPLRGTGSVLPLCRGLDGRARESATNCQAPDCQRLPKAGHSTRTTDAARPRRTDDGQDVLRHC